MAWKARAWLGWGPCWRPRGHHFTCKKEWQPKVFVFSFNQKANKKPLRFNFSSMVEGRRKVQKMRVLHRTPSFGLDVQLMTPLRWPERRAHDWVGGHVGGPWGTILRAKNNERKVLGFFIFNQKSNKNPLRFTFSSMVEGSRKGKKESIAHKENLWIRCTDYEPLKMAWKVRAWFGWWPCWKPLGRHFTCKKGWKASFCV